jgi:hypothetical protein
VVSESTRHHVSGYNGRDVVHIASPVRRACVTSVPPVTGRADARRVDLERDPYGRYAHLTRQSRPAAVPVRNFSTDVVALLVVMMFSLLLVTDRPIWAAQKNRVTAAVDPIWPIRKLLESGRPSVLIWGRFKAPSHEVGGR